MPRRLEIDERTKRAIGRLHAAWPGQPTTGTAFLVSATHILTAFHVVGDRAAFLANGSIVFSERIQFTPSGSTEAIPATPLPACADGRGDWALLQLARSIGADPLPLGDCSWFNQREAAPFGSWGYPSAAAIAASGVVVEGHVRDWTARYQQAKALELHCDFVTAGTATLKGLSGAPCIIDGTAVGILRANLTADGVAGVVGATVYACPLELLSPECWTTVEPPNPNWGLSSRPRTPPLPPKPYRDLRWYEENHISLFFGRGMEIRALIDSLTLPGRPRLVHVYGQSGVGKSSLLRAGLAPRIRATRSLAIGHRVKDRPLVATFEALLAEAASGGSPPLVVLDQIEEVYAEAGKANPDGEVSTLLAAAANALAENGSLHVLLSFRAEWLAEVKSETDLSDVAAAYVHVRPLARPGIEEVVRGVSHEELRHFYDMDVEPGLPSAIATWLLADPTSPVSPILSIVMTRLWDRAKASGGRCLTLADFTALAREKLDLDKFAEDQLERVRKSHQDVVDSGLVLDLLHRLTTEHGATEPASEQQLQLAYQHAFVTHPHSSLDGLLTELEEQSLVYTAPHPDHGRVKRLAHDTLASPVRKLFASSVRPGQRARRVLEARARDWHAGPDNARRAGEPFDRADLRTVQAGLPGMRAPTEVELDLIAASLQRDRRRSASRWGVAGLGITAAASVAAALFFTARQDTFKAQEYYGRALSLANAKEFLSAEVLLANAIRLDDRPPYREALLDVRMHSPQRRSVSPLPAGCERVLAISPNGDFAACVGTSESVTVYPVGDGRAGSSRSYKLGVRTQTSKELRGEFSADGSLLVLAGENAVQWQQMSATGTSSSLATDAAAKRIAVCGATAEVVALAMYGKPPKVLTRLGGQGQELGSVIGENIEAMTFNGRCDRLSLSSGDNVVENWKKQNDIWVLESTFTLHRDVVRSLAFATGDLLVSGGADATIRLSSAASGTETSRLTGGSDLRFVAVSASGRRILGKSYDQTVRVWERDGGAALMTIREFDARRGGVGTRADLGIRVAGFVRGREDQIFVQNGLGEVEIWDLFNNREGAVLLDTGSVAALDFLPDSSGLISAGDDEPDSKTLPKDRKAGIRLWDLQQPRVLRRFNAQVPIQNVRFLSKGSRVVTSDVQGRVRVWDTASGEALDSISPSARASWALAVAPPVESRGELLLLGDPDDLRLTMWDVEAAKVVRTLDAAAFPPAGKERALSAVGLYSGWRGRNGNPRNILVAGSDRLVFLDVSQAPKALAQFSFGRGIYSIAFDQDRKLVAAASTNREVRLFDVRDIDDIKPGATVPWRHDGAVNSVTFCAGWLLSAGSDGIVRMTDPSHPEHSIPLHAHGAPAWWVTCNEDQTLAASGSIDGTVRTFDLKRVQSVLSATPASLLAQSETFSGLSLVGGQLQPTATSPAATR